MYTAFGVRWDFLGVWFAARFVARPFGLVDYREMHNESGGPVYGEGEGVEEE